MTPGQLQTSVRRAADLLTFVDLLSDRRERPDYSELRPSEIRSTAYPTLWERCLQRGWYDLRLVDESFFQFRLGPEFSFCFYEPPVRAQSFEDFAVERFGDDWMVLGDDLRGEYDLYLDSLPRDWPATPVRFDFSPSLYRSPGHPAAHIHFGYSSEIRIATRRILAPDAFVLFVLRQYYPDAWETIVQEKGAAYVLRRGRNSLDFVADEHWCDRDNCEMHLS